MTKRIFLSKKSQAIVALVATAFGYALMSVAVRLMGEGFEPMTQVCLRLFFGSLLSLLVLGKNVNWATVKILPKKDWLTLFLMGFLGYAVAVYLITLGALTSKIVNVSIIFSTTPFFVYFYSYFFLKKPIKISLILLLTVSLLGVSIVASKSFIPAVSGFDIGELYTLLSAAAFGTYYVARKKLSSRLNNSEITVIVMPIAALFSFTFALMKGENIAWQSFKNTSALLGLTIGAIQNLTSTLFTNFAFKHIDAVLGSQILLTESLFALLLGLILYREFLSAPEADGALLIICSVYITNKFLI